MQPQTGKQSFQFLGVFLVQVIDPADFRRVFIPFPE